MTSAVDGDISRHTPGSSLSGSGALDETGHSFQPPDGVLRQPERQGKVEHHLGIRRAFYVSEMAEVPTWRRGNRRVDSQYRS